MLNSMMRKIMIETLVFFRTVRVYCFNRLLEKNVNYFSKPIKEHRNIRLIFEGIEPCTLCGIINKNNIVAITIK